MMHKRTASFIGSLTTTRLVLTYTRWTQLLRHQPHSMGILRAGGTACPHARAIVGAATLGCDSVVEAPTAGHPQVTLAQLGDPASTLGLVGAAALECDSGVEAPVPRDFQRALAQLGDRHAELQRAFTQQASQQQSSLGAGLAGPLDDPALTRAPMSSFAAAQQARPFDQRHGSSLVRTAGTTRPWVGSFVAATQQTRLSEQQGRSGLARTTCTIQ
jgi:hypothetical protein